MMKFDNNSEILWVILNIEVHIFTRYPSTCAANLMTALCLQQLDKVSAVYHYAYL